MIEILSPVWQSHETGEYTALIPKAVDLRKAAIANVIKSGSVSRHSPLTEAASGNRIDPAFLNLSPDGGLEILRGLGFHMMFDGLTPTFAVPPIGTTNIVAPVRLAFLRWLPAYCALSFSKVSARGKSTAIRTMIATSQCHEQPSQK